MNRVKCFIITLIPNMKTVRTGGFKLSAVILLLKRPFYWLFPHQLIEPSAASTATSAAALLCLRGQKPSLDKLDQEWWSFTRTLVSNGDVSYKIQYAIYIGETWRGRNSDILRISPDWTSKHVWLLNFNNVCTVSIWSSWISLKVHKYQYLLEIKKHKPGSFRT